jgi:hypothetical protein
MSGNVTANQAALIKAQVYSNVILESLQEGLLPEGLIRDVSDFGDGETLFIPVKGETTLRDYVEDTDVKYDPIDTGQVSLSITEYVTAATYVTRKLRQDSYAISAIEADIPADHVRLIKERYESDVLKAHSQAQVAADPNTINGFDHRWVANSGTTLGVVTLEDFLYMKLAFDKAHVPEEGRIAIVDSIVEASLNKAVADQAFVNNPQFEGLVGEGFAKSRRFVRNIFGFDVWVSDRCERVAAETINGGPQGASTAGTDLVANVFLSVLDDMTKPVMGAWRQHPITDGEFVKNKQRDEFVTSSRWGLGAQRLETLGVVLSSQTLYK